MNGDLPDDGRVCGSGGAFSGESVEKGQFSPGWAGDIFGIHAGIGSVVQVLLPCIGVGFQVIDWGEGTADADDLVSDDGQISEIQMPRGELGTRMAG